MATENPTWGYMRIRDALYHVGCDVARSTVADILSEQGLDPAPGRAKRMSWKAFLRAHWGAICAADFFTVEVLTLRGLIRYHVLFVMELRSRRVHVAGIIEQPHSDWILQVARNLLDTADGFLRSQRYLLIDRDPLFTREFRDLLRSGGVEPVRLPARSPNLNAHAERFIRSIRSECLSRLVPLGELHLRTAIREYVAHYNAERPHQGLGGALLEPASHVKTRRSDAEPATQCRTRLGGMLRFYHRHAA
jgi:transposase InsO family protein